MEKVDNTVLTKEVLDSAKEILDSFRIADRCLAIEYAVQIQKNAIASERNLVEAKRNKIIAISLKEFFETYSKK